MSTLKRFRPSVDSICSYGQCTELPSTVPCAHCPSVFCLDHLFEHQRLIDNEHKRLLSGIENCRIRLKMIQFNDNRYELFQQLNEWKKNMMENVERMKNEINDVYEQCDQEFNNIKEDILNNDNEDEMSLDEILTNLERNLHTLESSRLKLIMLQSTPMIRVLKPNFNSSLSYSQSLIRPDLDQLLSHSETVFTLDDYDVDDATLFATSPDHLIIYKYSTSILQLFNHLGQHLFDIDYDSIVYGDLNQITWSSFLNEFFLATSKQLLQLDCSTQCIRHYVDTGFGFYKDVCAGSGSILLVHNLGTSLGDVIEHYSDDQLIQRCWKSDLYPDEMYIKETMSIVCIRMSSHLLAIHALFTDTILICDILRAMKCLFQIEMKCCSILSISPIYDTQQWLLFITDKQDERRMFVINALESDTQRRMRELKYDDHLPRNISFFGSNHFILIPREDDFECRKISHIL